MLKQLFSSSNGVISEDMIESAAKKVLLPSHECSIWLNHLRTVVENRSQGLKRLQQPDEQSALKLVGAGVDRVHLHQQLIW